MVIMIATVARGLLDRLVLVHDGLRYRCGEAHPYGGVCHQTDGPTSGKAGKPDRADKLERENSYRGPCQALLFQGLQAGADPQ